MCHDGPIHLLIEFYDSCDKFLRKLDKKVVKEKGRKSKSRSVTSSEGSIKFEENISSWRVFMIQSFKCLP